MPESNVEGVHYNAGKRPGQMAFDFVVEPTRNPDPCRTREELPTPDFEVSAISGLQHLRASDAFGGSIDEEDDIIDLEPVGFEGVFTQKIHLPGVLGRLDHRQPRTSAQLIKQLALTIPRNELNLPVYIYRTDMLDAEYVFNGLERILTSTTAGSTSTTVPASGALSLGASSQEISDSINAARVVLDYKEGYPSTPDGAPLWQQLAFETPDAFDAFVQYLDLEGVRTLASLISYPMSMLQEWYHVNYWQIRIEAFDAYKLVHSRRQKIQRALRAEDTHFRMAERLLKTIHKRFDSIVEDDLADYDLMKLATVFEKLVKVQRISVGLSANGDKIEDDNPRKNPAVQVIMQQTVKNNAGDAEIVGSESTEQFVQAALDDPQTFADMQSLILRMQQAQIGEK